MIENLRPFDQRTVDERREIARSGGIASGKARNELKQLKAVAKAFLEDEWEDGDIKMTGAAYAFSQLWRSLDDPDKRIQAFNAIRDIAGEKPKDEIDLKTNENADAFKNYVESIKKE